MAGIYIHIPFCKQACSYCDFHFSTSTHYKNEVLNSILKEIELQKSYLDNATINSIYFGGGTPSILEATEIQQIINAIYNYFSVNSNIEITLEANPDDVNFEKFSNYYSLGINRLSIGIQSFYNQDLMYMNRSHTAEEAEKALKTIAKIGFTKFSMDLIYGTPTLSDTNWISNLNKVQEFDCNHLSCYALTVEENTPLHKKIKQNQLPNISSEASANQFEILCNWAIDNNFNHYEISNLCKNDAFGFHNSNYWKGEHYLGIGPSAHSFNGISRQYNIANNTKYIQSIAQNLIPAEIEFLSSDNKYNELIMTGFRTVWGIKNSQILELETKYQTHFNTTIKNLTTKQLILETSDGYTTSPKGKLLLNKVYEELFY